MADNSEFATTGSVLTTQEVWQMANPPAGNGHPNPAELAYLMWLASEDREEQSLVTTYRNYYEGEHKYQLTDRMKEFLELDSNIKFDLNYLPIAVDTLVERLSVIGFKAGEQGGEFTDDDPGILCRWWNENRMDALQKEVHFAALRDRESYVLVEWDEANGRPKFSKEEVYDGSVGMTLIYDAQGNIIAAVKRWRGENTQATAPMRLNIYTAAAVYKFIAGRSGWDEYREKENDPWPLPWLDDDDQPLGVTVAHFDNRKSELHDLIPAQDALNKAVIDEIAGADTEGFQLITLSGGVAPGDLEIGPRRIIHAPEGTWGSIAPGDLSSLSAIVDKYIIRMAQISRTPLAYFQITGQVASAETQKADDTGLVSKAEDRGVRFGNAWEDAMAHARRLHNRFGDGSKLEDAAISTMWDSFERVNAEESERKAAETAEIKARTFKTLIEQRIPRSVAARLAGYSKQDIEEMGQASRTLPQDTIDGNNPSN